MDYQSKYLKYKNKYIDLKNKQSHVQQGGNANSKPTVYLFKAEWCGHCQTFKPTWDGLQEKYRNKYHFITYDSDKNSREIKEWNVGGFPTIYFKNGNNATEYNGPRDVNSLVKFFEEQK
jgi:thiol-disulfide isomerase/thioredoxin